jgi:hypothetical protein
MTGVAMNVVLLFALRWELYLQGRRTTGVLSFRAGFQNRFLAVLADQKQTGIPRGGHAPARPSAGRSRMPKRGGAS